MGKDSWNQTVQWADSPAPCEEAATQGQQNNATAKWTLKRSQESKFVTEILQF